MIEQQALSLFELMSGVKDALKSAFASPVWVIAEITECNMNRTGHCYLELVEKSQSSDKLVAKAKATIWSGVCTRLFPYFESVTGETLHVGMKVLVRVTVEMHEAFGFSLNIQDIDAQYTLGDIAQQRAKVIAQLAADGVIDMNRQLPLPLVIQRIAVISSDTAAGWGDFQKQLADNPYGYDFSVELFPSQMQGDGAADSIIDAFNQIFSRLDEFDAVAIMRGGGSKSDLSCFDQYLLAYNAAQFPLPVITGIGHERDDSVLDLVACVRLKTPTAVAAFLIEKAASFENLLEEKCQSVFDAAMAMIDSNIQRIEHDCHMFAIVSGNCISRKQELLSRYEMSTKVAVLRYFDAQQYRIDAICQNLRLLPKLNVQNDENVIAQIEQRFKLALVSFFDKKQKHLEQLEQTNNHLNPQNVLKRGYAIVRSGGKAVKSPRQVNSGDEISIQTIDGFIDGLVK